MSNLVGFEKCSKIDKCEDKLLSCFIQNYCSIITQIECILNSTPSIKEALESRLIGLAKEKNFKDNFDDCVLSTITM
jgi:hypothetical protein